MSGLPDINMEDWKNNTEYIGFSDSDETIEVGLMLYLSLSELITRLANSPTIY